MNQDELASMSIGEIAQQLAALAATLRELAETPIFDKPANDDEAGMVNSKGFLPFDAGAHRGHAAFKDRHLSPPSQNVASVTAG